MGEKKRQRASAESPVDSPPDGGSWNILISWAAHPLVLAGVCFLLALAVRLYVAHFYAKSPDNFQYLSLAADMAGGAYFRRDFKLEDGLLNSRRLVPLYPALIAAGIKLSADPEIFGAWVSIIASSLTVFPLFWGGSRLGGKWAGAMACLFYCVMPLDLHVASHILSESLFGLLTVSTVVCVLRLLERPGTCRAAAAGLFCALSYLCRDIGFGYFILALLSLGLSRQAGLSLREKVWPALVLLLVFCVVSLPFWIFIKVHTGGFQISLRAGRDLSAALMGYEKGSRPLMEEEWEEEGITESKAAGRIEVLKAAVKTGRLAWNYLAAAGKGIPWTFWVFLFAGLFPGGQRWWLGVWVVSLWVVSALEVYALLTPYMVDVRYTLPSMILCTLWAGRGAVELLGWGRRFRGGRMGEVVSVAAGVVVFLGTVDYGWKSLQNASYYRAFYSRENFKGKTVAGVKESAADIRRVLGVPAGSRILARKPFFAYYLHGRPVEIAESVEGVKAQLAESVADYVIIESLEVRRYRRGLKPLLTEADPLPGAPLVYRRYFREYNRLVSVYQPGGKAIGSGFPLFLDPADGGRLTQLAEEASALYQEGYIENARQILLSVLAAQPDHLTAHSLLLKIYLIYGNYDGISLDRAEDELRKCQSLSPHFLNVKEYKEIIEKLRLYHQATWAAP